MPPAIRRTLSGVAMLLAIGPGLLRSMQPDPAALVPLFRQALEERTKLYGTDDARVARAARDLGLLLRSLHRNAEAEPLFLQSLAIDTRVLGEKDRQVGADLENLASVVADPSEALSLTERAAHHPDPEISARNLARLAEHAPRGKAAGLYRQALEREEQASGKESERVAVRLNDLALALPPKQAEPLLRRALQIQVTKLGVRHPETATTQNNLANVLLAMGEVARAEPLLRQALGTLEAMLGRNHLRVAAASSNLGDVLRAKGNLAGARRLYERTLAIDEAVYGKNHPEVAADLRNLAGLLDEMGQAAEGRKLLDRAERIGR
ncbi:MAG: hypothetical protein IANPNBLG_02947 [Bryobacteraceae bacterium]|nr:hypothetical protein [Bryobacteraceae bacterium]